METQKTRSTAAWWIGIVVVGALAFLLLAVTTIGDLFGKDSGPVEDPELETVATEERAELNGPELIVAGMVEFTYVNSMDQGAWVAGLRFPDEEAWAAELAILDTGENQALTPLDPVPALIAFSTWIEPGTELTESVSLPRGFYVIDWLTNDEFGNQNYVWRAGAIEARE